MASLNRHRTTNAISITPLRFSVLVFGILAVLLTGCNQDEIHDYWVPREIDESARAQQQMEAAAQEQSQSAQVMWEIPRSWNQLDIEVSMRVATFMTPPGIEVTVAAFPGDVGGLLANVNRWRGQIGLEPVTEQNLAESIEVIEGTESYLVDISGSDIRLVGTVIDIGDGHTWFVKTIGLPDEVEQVKVDIAVFSASFRLSPVDHSTHNHPPGEHSTSDQPTSDQPTSDHPSSDQPTADHPTADHPTSDHPTSDHPTGDHPSEISPKPVVDTPPSKAIFNNWQQPTEWRVDPDASSILMAAYFSESGARITLTSLSGTGGGNLDNIDRWRGQINLPAVQSLADQPSQAIGNGGMIVDLVSDDGTNRIIAGIVPVDSLTLFFKLTGSVSETEPELERFHDFVKGVGTGRQGGS